MAKFISQLVSENLISEWAETLDWLFDDTKFLDEHNWNSGYVGLFTKRVKKIEGLSECSSRFICDKKENIKFPLLNFKRKNDEITIIILKGSSIGKDLVRHIRNGIAHGNANISKNNKELYIEIEDFSDSNKERNKQTAYLYIPLSYITTFYKIYSEIDKSIRNTKGKDREERRKYR